MGIVFDHEKYTDPNPWLPRSTEPAIIKAQTYYMRFTQKYFSKAYSEPY